MQYYVNIHPSTNVVQQLSALTGPISAADWHQIAESEYDAADAAIGQGKGLTYDPATGAWGGLQ